MTDTPACWAWERPAVIDVDAYGQDMIWSWQAGRCAVCGCMPDLMPMHVRSMYEDHDHATGLTRGYLCHSCNTREGHRKNADHPLFVAYRERHPAAILGVQARYTLLRAS